MTGSELLPPDFGGIVRLFPLPDLVMFPHVVQPLRVFEPRYVQMFEDALDDDQLLTMAILQPGWERDYEGHPPLFPTLCVGRILSHSQQPDGSYHLLLAGAARAQLMQELDCDTPYRQAEVELLPDAEDGDTDELTALHAQLLRAFRKLSPESVGANHPLQQMLEYQVGLGVLTDVIAFAAPLKRIDKQYLLGELDVKKRALRVIHHLQELRAATPHDGPAAFPPSFSDN
ncbi:MAG: LON peptidase substrate-binding domain-containing protein [Planctomycetales bacterium]|nr:LON peptidase substrate-binding domain-containing protein [Planctomycetales bacterium]MCA9169035.1 LON peptidase substrate-binding domain-containing protein [Planctomycetales bacterium]